MALSYQFSIGHNQLRILTALSVVGGKVDRYRYQKEQKEWHKEYYAYAASGYPLEGITLEEANETIKRIKKERGYDKRTKEYTALVAGVNFKVFRRLSEHKHYVGNLTRLKQKEMIEELYPKPNVHRFQLTEKAILGLRMYKDEVDSTAQLLAMCNLGKLKLPKCFI